MTDDELLRPGDLVDITVTGARVIEHVPGFGGYLRFRLPGDTRPWVLDAEGPAVAVARTRGGRRHRLETTGAIPTRKILAALQAGETVAPAAPTGFITTTGPTDQERRAQRRRTVWGALALLAGAVLALGVCGGVTLLAGSWPW